MAQLVMVIETLVVNEAGSLRKMARCYQDLSYEMSAFEAEQLKCSENPTDGRQQAQS